MIFVSGSQTVLKGKKMTRKTNTVLIGLLGTILMGLSNVGDYNTGRTPELSHC
jgi:hypothetical protein